METRRHSDHRLNQPATPKHSSSAYFNSRFYRLQPEVLWQSDSMDTYISASDQLYSNSLYGVLDSQWNKCFELSESLRRFIMYELLQTASVGCKCYWRLRLSEKKIVVLRAQEFVLFSQWIWRTFLSTLICNKWWIVEVEWHIICDHYMHIPELSLLGSYYRGILRIVSRTRNN